MSNIEDTQSGKEKRRERNKQVRRIGKDKSNNTLAQDAPRVSGPIDGQRFTNARLYEVNSMQNAIKSASYAINELAFQSLPRGLRRRAASHNLNRLPARLREKAAHEAASSGLTAGLGRKRVGKIKPPKNIVREFLRRQKSKKWLETHMWHTKRMKMVNIWGHRLASRPNTKSARVIYRASTRLSIIHDASYWSCLQLEGELDDIEKVVKTLTDPTASAVASERYNKGNRVGTGYLYQYMSYPKKLISPISFLWKPETKDTLWLWVHPAGRNEALEAIKTAIEKQHVNNKVQFSDLHNDMLRFDLTGPRSTALLQAILDPINDTDAGNKVWHALKDLRSSTSLPPGAVIGLTVHDPRLKFPQKVPPRTHEISSQSKLNDLLKHWPNHVASVDIWNHERRKGLLNKQTEHQLNLRRQDQLLPGTKLEPTGNDSTIPVLLLQRGQTLENAHSTNSNELLEGWSLVVPHGWGLAFWKSFIFAGARVAGFDDVRAMHFENGYPCFPCDFPGTNAFEHMRHLYKQAHKSVWDRKPPSKRVNFKKMCVEHPFEAAFESLSKVDTMVEDDGPMYSLIQGSTLSTLLENTDTYTTSIKKAAQRRHLDLDYTFECSQLLAKVRVHYFHGGKPSSNALIYALTDEALYQHLTQYIHRQPQPLKQSKRQLKEMQDMEGENKVNKELPSKLDHIGYITNGGFSLALGHGFGIGACSIDGLKNIKHLDEKYNRSLKMVVLVRNTNSLEARPARLEVLF